MFTIDKKGSKDAKDSERKGKLKKRKQTDEVDDEERELQSALFGTPDIFPENEDALDQCDDVDVPSKGTTSDGAVWHDDDDDTLVVNVKSSDRLKKLRKAEEEEELNGEEFSLRLRQQFEKSNPSVSWETRRSKEVAELDDATLLLQSSKRIIGRGAIIPQSVLEVERLKDANIEDASDAVIQSVRFHPHSQLMLSAGLDKRLKLFQIDGKTNPKVQGVFFENLPIRNAEFSADGNEIFLSGRRKFFYVYDLASASIQKVESILGRQEKTTNSIFVSPDNSSLIVLGNCGHVTVLSRRTKQWIADLKMNHDASAAAFSPDGHTLYTAGGAGLVYLWDMRTRKCVGKVADQGSLGVSQLAVSPDGEQLACGSLSGVVNLYSLAALRAAPMGSGGACAPEPRKTMMNLTTAVSSCRFNPDGQLLATASQTKKEGLRVAHVGGGTVFANWPTRGTPLHYVSSLDFSPDASMLAIGNDRGKVLLYRLKHYASACS